MSKKLDLTTLPESSCDVVQLGGVVYYKLTLPALVWFETAIADLDATRPPPAVAREIAAAQDAIYAFARSRWGEGEIAAARAAGASPLPDPPAHVA